LHSAGGDVEINAWLFGVAVKLEFHALIAMFRQELGSRALQFFFQGVRVCVELLIDVLCHRLELLYLQEIIVRVLRHERLAHACVFDAFHLDIVACAVVLPLLMAGKLFALFHKPINSVEECLGLGYAMQAGTLDGVNGFGRCPVEHAQSLFGARV
jgi:hypothetical protein